MYTYHFNKYYDSSILEPRITISNSYIVLTSCTNVYCETIQYNNRCNFHNCLIIQDVAHSLKELLEYDGDVEEDLCLTFQASIGQNGKMITEDLLEG